MVTIGGLAAELGVSIDTVRYYERRGLLPEPERTGAGYRLYGDEDRWRLAFILRAKHLGFTLRESVGLLEQVADHSVVGDRATPPRPCAAPPPASSPPWRRSVPSWHRSPPG